MDSPLQIFLDRGTKLPLSTQIYLAIGKSIRDGRLEPGARLPSWRDLSTQLGVARGTVRAAYERLSDEQLIVAAGAAGTHVARRLPAAAPPNAPAPAPAPLPELLQDFGERPLDFQMGVPAQDAFPYKLWSRVLARAARSIATAPVSYPDPRGDPLLRREIAGYLAIARGMRCLPEQVIVTNGYAGALGLVIHALRLSGRTAWMEDPGFPLTRKVLESWGVRPVPVPVNEDGLDVAAAVATEPSAALAVVTPGQQAPLGVSLSQDRRAELLDWAQGRGAWILEDDYLSELQLEGRVAPALASLDRSGRVLHAGSFSKTLSPTLRLGFLVAPEEIANRLGTSAALMGAVPGAVVQRAVAEFIAEGHYFRHLRRMKRLYEARRQWLLRTFRPLAPSEIEIVATGGLSLRIELPPGANDREVARRARDFALAPVPLSPWSLAPPGRSGLLLGITNFTESRVEENAARLLDLIRRYG